MLEYLQQYNNLPQSLRDALAAPGIIAAIHNLETKYKISLALVVIKAAIGELTPANLAAGLVTDCKLAESDAARLASDLKQSIFFVLPAFKASPIVKLGNESKVESRTVPAGRQESESLEMKSRLDVVSTGTSATLSTGASTVDERVTDLIKKAKIDLASQSLIDRLRQILRTYLLGVRDRIAAMDALTKPIELGGLAFSKVLAEDLLRIADGKTAAAISQNVNTRPSLPVSLDATSRELGYDLMTALAAKGQAKAPINPLSTQSRLVQQQQTNPNAVIKKTVLPTNLPWQADGTRSIDSGVVKASPIVKLEVKKSAPEAHQPGAEKVSVLSRAEAESLVKATSTTLSTGTSAVLSTSPAVAEKKVEIAPALNAKPAITDVVKTIPLPAIATEVTVIKDVLAIVTKEALKPTSTKLSTGVVKVAPERYNKTESGEIKMDDVHFTPRVFTPIDELKYMTLKNFRNLNADPVAATEIVKHKLEALAKDDFSWRLEGISAWKQCPVNKMYVDIYHTAMSEGKQIGQVIEAKQKASPEALTSAEFEAIFSFNQEISLYK